MAIGRRRRCAYSDTVRLAGLLAITVGSDLAHSRTSADATLAAAHVGGGPRREAREDGCDGECCETKPEEGVGGLRLGAALVPVVRAVGDRVTLGVVLLCC